MLPKPGAIMAFSFVTDQGAEGYTYNWTDQMQMDASKPLGLLSHVGGSPILAVVSRSKVSIKCYDGCAKWITVGYGYFEKYGLPQMPESDRESFNAVAEMVWPLIKRAHETNREMLLPALDGQVGLVLDAKLTSKQFIKDLPATKEPMPMVEPALLLGVKDSGLMRQALVAYWEILQGALDVAEKIEPEAAELPIPEPENVQTSNGEMFVFTPPEECPVDKQISPNVGLGESVCVFSASKAHTERLLKTTPLAVGGVLAKPDRPLAVAACFDWAGLLSAAKPWADLATDEILRNKMGDDAVKTQSPGIKKQVHTVLDVLSVLRRVTSETYVKDGVTVTHTRTEIRDVD